jgi:hypothetical protein
MDLFLKSERISDDLSLAFEQPDKWSQCVVLREWVEIPLYFEMRGFVYDRKLTALSQYYSVSVYDEILTQASKLEEKIRDFVAQIGPLLPCEAVVMDIGVEEKSGRVFLIELNPFNDYEGCGTSAAMFDWTADREVLEGRAPFEFRIETEVKSDADIEKMLGNNWRELVFPKSK